MRMVIGGLAEIWDVVRSVFLWCVGLAWLLAGTASMLVLGRIMGHDRIDWLTRAYCRWQIRLTGARWTAHVDPSIRKDQQYFFMQNHVNLLDHASTYNATPQFKQGVNLAAHFRIPMYGWWMKDRGTIPVWRGRGKAGIEDLKSRMADEVARGNSLIVFPEGTRTLDGRVGKFRKGVFLMARDLGVAVVPVTVTGMYEIMRKGSWKFRFGGPVTAWCDAPVEMAGLSDEQVLETMETIRVAMAARVDDYMEARHG